MHIADKRYPGLIPAQPARGFCSARICSTNLGADQTARKIKFPKQKTITNFLVKQKKSHENQLDLGNTTLVFNK